MAATINEHFLLENEGVNLEIYKNNSEEIFCGAADYELSAAFWFTINKDDWEELKQFIDNQFKT